jgi:hypothetical protein
LIKPIYNSHAGNLPNRHGSERAEKKGAHHRDFSEKDARYSFKRDFFNITEPSFYIISYSDSYKIGLRINIGLDPAGQYSQFNYDEKSWLPGRGYPEKRKNSERPKDYCLASWYAAGGL